MNKKLRYLVMCLFAFCFANAQFTSIAIVGDGTGPNGWPGESANPGPVDAKQMLTADGGITWTYDNLVTFQGSVKFRADNSWTNNWGGATFPDGTGLFDSQTNNIPTIAGVYDVTFNSTTLAYSFVAQNLYPVVSLVGPGVVGGSWDLDTDMATTDGIHYSVSQVALSGAVKFRQDHGWATNWGASAFPSGTAVFDDESAIDVPTGTYNVTFNKNTLEYNIYFSTIAIVGDATPNGWPLNTPGEIDPHTLSTTDGVNYFLNSITLMDGVAKFRANNAWIQEWSANTFPDGTGTQSGGGIPATAGTYSITLNTSTGAYSFADPVAGTANFSKVSIMVYPNPTQSVWNFTSENDIQSIEITDVSGKNILTVNPKNKEANINVSGLSSGLYFAKIIIDNSYSTIKLLKN
ncbi:T9SS type A sorting domain-containing protein [Flavobacterium zepuense]|uniref:T9SS type A sorting domain-containing protein n=1 Tax=Flavobacterium zepuense TaxID=2593302 RepID=A0A552VAT4_9FLAO|nr:T9SS type A sorting domain-containing protein [Flavobacterium zepuense]TRW27470.1 T9SS type A sorting domain-containing protein [Flavobacterium zepuense]